MESAWRYVYHFFGMAHFYIYMNAESFRSVLIVDLDASHSLSLALRLHRNLSKSSWPTNQLNFVEKSRFNDAITICICVYIGLLPILVWPCWSTVVKWNLNLSGQTNAVSMGEIFVEQITLIYQRLTFCFFEHHWVAFLRPPFWAIFIVKLILRKFPRVHVEWLTAIFSSHWRFQNVSVFLVAFFFLSPLSPISGITKWS